MVTENRRYYWLTIEETIFFRARNEAHEGASRVGKKSQSSTEMMLASLAEQGKLYFEGLAGI